MNGGKLKLHYTIDFFGGHAAEKVLIIDVSAKTTAQNGKEKSGKTPVTKRVPQKKQ